MANRGPIHIQIDNNELSNSSSYNNSLCSSRSSRSSQSVDSIYSYSISPMSYSSYSPERRIPTANNIVNISNYIADVIPFEFNHGDDIESGDEESLILSDSTFTHSTNSFYNEVEYNRICYIINLFNSLIFLVFSIIDKKSVNDMNPDYQSIIYYAITLYPECQDVRSKLWKLITYSFVHGDIIHLFGNVIGLYFVTANLYKFQKWANIFFIYFVTVINGALSFYLTNPYDALIGASGGVYGIAGSNLANYVYNYDNMYSYEIVFSNLFIVIFICIDLINYFVTYNENIAYQTHWYCFITGLLFGLSIFNYKKSTNYKKYLRFFGIFLFSYLNSLFIFNYIFNYPAKYSLNYFNIEKEESCCYDLLNHEQNSTFVCQNLHENNLFY